MTTTVTRADTNDPVDDEVDQILNAAIQRVVYADSSLTAVRPTDRDEVACARWLVAALNAIDRAELDAARAALAAADRHAADIDGVLPSRLRWFLEYIRGDVATYEGEIDRAVEHLDRASDIAAVGRLDREWLRSSANAMIALRSASRPREIIDRLNRLFEMRGRTSTDSLFYQVVADTMNWLGRPRTALRVRMVGMDRRTTSDAWWYRNHREIARYHVAVRSFSDARASLDATVPLKTSVGARERLSTREVEMSLLLAEGRPHDVLQLIPAPDQLRSAPRMAIHAADAALQVGDADRAATFLRAIDVSGADDGIRAGWFAIEARRLELVGDRRGAAAAQRAALGVAAASRPPTTAVNALVARVEAWLDGEPSPSRPGRAEAMEGGLSDLRSALGTLMMLCDLGDLDNLVHAEASLAEVHVLIEAMSIEGGEQPCEPIDLHQLATAVLAQVEPIARERQITLVNGVQPALDAEGPSNLLEVALQGICVVAATELDAGQTLVIDASASPLDIAITLPDTTDRQHRQLLRWFETTVARGHHGAASRHRLSVLGLPLARLWTVGLFTSIADLGDATQFRIASETSKN